MSSLRPGRAPSLGDGLWSRRLLSLAVATAVTAAVATPLLRAPRFEFGGAICLFWLMVGADQLANRWWPRRDARLVWTARVAGRDAVEPGLVARRSLAGWADLATGLAWVGGGALTAISLPPADQQWGRVLRVLLILGLAAGLGWAAYREVRFTGRLALTASGIRYGSRRYDWTNVDRAVPRRRDGRFDGVRLRQVIRRPLELDPVVGGRDTAVPEERLVAAIEEYRQRAQVLAGGPVTAPEPIADPEAAPPAPSDR